MVALWEARTAGIRNEFPPQAGKFLTRLVNYGTVNLVITDIDCRMNNCKYMSMQSRL